MNNYLHIALWIVLFYDAIVMLLLPSSVNLLAGTDGSAARFAVDMVAIILAGYVLTIKGFNKLENKWSAVFLALMVASHFHSPNIQFDSGFLPKDIAIYNYKPMLEIIIFFLMFMAVSSIELTQFGFNKIAKSLCWIAVIYSAYIVFQRLGIDQLYAITGDQEISQMSRNPEAGGFISQPVFAAAFLATCMPFLVKNKSYWMIGLVMAAIIITGNRSACIAAFIVTLMMSKFWIRAGKLLLIAYVSFLIGSLLICSFLPNIHIDFHDTGRLGVWKGLFCDFIHPAFPGVNKHYILTGHGIGSFSVLFPFFHKSGFYQAHNEFFEVIYTTGILGMITFILMAKDIFKRITNKPVVMGILAISICALTNPVWHVPQLAFLTVFLIGLGYNQSFKQGVVNVT